MTELDGLSGADGAEGADGADGVDGVEPLAIVGMACRVPGAADLDGFWRNLAAGVDSVRFFSREEQAALGVPPDELDDPDFVAAAQVVDGVADFDAGFFGMTPREAALADPQHRMFLELAHTALEDAGCDPARFAGPIGVYAGSGLDDYRWRHVRRNRRIMATSGTTAVHLVNLPDYVATLVSYKLNLRGPALTVHTACSTSLVALHLACEALRGGECDLALAGGVCIELPPGRGYRHVEGGTESPDGHCRPFDARAAGTVWGSGGGVVAVRRLDDALAAGDHIRAIVLGNAINNDGSAKVGFSAPSADGQQEVVTQALGLAGVDPRTIGYVEAHGTGTVLGDPIEAAALTRVFGAGRSPGAGHSPAAGRCALGSVKSNIGHLSQASGIAGVIKTVLALEHRQIPPTVHFAEPNPEIDLDGGPFHVPTVLTPWQPPPGVPRRAGVSSFGMGGTNAHIVLQEAPPRAAAAPPPGRGDATPGPAGAGRTAELLRVSAKSDEALAATVERLAEHLDAHPGLRVADVAATLRLGRTEHRHRAIVVAADAADAAAGLRNRLRTGVAATGLRVALLFSGQGGQYAGMGAEPYEREPVFRAAVDRCAAVLAGGFDLTGVMFGDDEELLRRTEFTQPALFTVGYALAELWRSWGVEADAMLGHSVGEYVAATLAGVFDLPDALRLVSLRGRLMQRQPAGSMVAVRCDEADLALPDGVSIAALNGPGSLVLSGPTPVLDRFADELRARGVQSTPLHTSHAFHSAMMDPVLEPFADAVAAAAPRSPDRPFLSNLTGGWADGPQVADPAYWVRHLREPVRFGDCVATLLGDGPVAMVECGPGRQLASLAAPLVPAGGPPPLPSLPRSDERRGATEVLLETAGRLWTHGVAPDPTATGPAGRRIPLPGYAYQRTRHWIDPDTGATEIATAAGPAGERQIQDWFHVPSWRHAPPRLDRPVPVRCLVFTADGPADDLTAALRAAGCEVVTVHPGDDYGRAEDGGFVLRPDRREDYDALLAELGGRLPARIVHAWSLAGEPAGTSLADTWLAQDLGFFSLLLLTQALAAAAPAEPVQLDAVTSGAVGVTGADLVRPEHATVAGIAKVVPLELPGVTVRHLDIDPVGPAARAVTELMRPADRALLVLRGGRAWVQEHQPAPIGPLADPTVALREEGVYLITGGLGGVGIALASDLAERVRARLVLFDRTGLPPREEWDSYLRVHGTLDRTGRAIDAVRTAEAAGARVLVLAADVTDADSLTAVRGRILAEFGRIDGIVHAAGIPGGGMVAVKRRADAERVLYPKIAGPLALHRAFGDLTLDFVVLCSSVSALVGGFGQVDYCAANNFMDAYARGAHGWDARVVAVQWSWWSDAGMAAEVTAPSAFRALEWGERTSPVDHPILTGRHTGPDGVQWCDGTVSPRTHWFLDEHRTDGVPIVPGTAHLEVLRQGLAATGAAPAGQVAELRDVVFAEPLPVADDGAAQVRVRFGQDGAGEVTSLAGGVSRLHARGSAGWVVPEPARTIDLAGVRARCVRHDPDDLPSLFRYGPHWEGLREVWLGPDEDLGLIEAPDVVAAELDDYGLHPSLLDVATLHAQRRSHGLYLPFGYGRVLIRGRMPARLWSHLRHRDQGDGALLVVDLTLYDEHGTEVVAITDYMLRRVDPSSVGATIATTVASGGVQDGTQGGVPGAAGATGGTGAARDVRTMAGETDAGGIGSAAGADAFLRVLAVDLGPQVVVCAEPLDLVIDRIHALTTDTVEENLTTTARGTRRGPVDDGRTPVQALVAQSWDDVLGTDGVGLDDDFFDLGGNSLVAVQLIAQVRQEFGVKLPMRTLFDSPTVAGIAEAVERLRAGEAGGTATAPEPGGNGATIPRLPRRPVREAGR